MKNLKRTLSLVLALVLAVGLLTVGAGAAFKDDEQITYSYAVELLTGLGVINGYEDGSFRPTENFDRGGLAKMVAYYAWGGKDMSKYYQGASVFADLDGYAWAAGSINYGFGTGYIAGAGVNADGKAIYNPAGTVKGSELAKVLLCLLGYNPKSTSPLYTLEGGNWELNTIRIAEKEGLFYGLDEDFDPTAALTREEAAQIFMNISLNVVYNNYNDDGSPKYVGSEEYALEAYFDAYPDDYEDDYGRQGVVFLRDGEELAKLVMKPDYVFANNGAETTIGKVLEAYNKANGTKFATDSSETVYTGEVYEFFFDGTDYDYICYDYEAVVVTDVKAAAAGSDYSYDITIKWDNGNEDVLSEKELGAVYAKGDVLAIPYSYDGDDEYEYADSVKLDAKTGKVSAFDKDDLYVVTSAGKFYFDSYYWELDDETMEIGGEYKLYISPVGTLIASEEVVAPVESYTTTFAYGLFFQSKAYESAVDGDLLGAGGSDAKAAKAVMQVVGLDGKVTVLNLAVKYDADKDNYFYTGTDNIFSSKAVTDQAKMAVDAFVEYYVDSNGDAVIVADYDGETVTLAEADKTVTLVDDSTEEATSSTVLKAVVYDSVKKSYSISTVTGYKNFKDLSAATGAVVLDKNTGKVATIYVYTEAEVVKPVPVIAAITKVGDYTADGYTYTVVINGVAGTYYSKDEYEVGYYEVVVDGTALKSADNSGIAAMTVANDAKISFVDDGYVDTDKGTVDFLKNTAVYDISGKSLSLAKDVVIDVFALGADDMVIFIVG